MGVVKVMVRVRCIMCAPKQCILAVLPKGHIIIGSIITVIRCRVGERWGKGRGTVVER